MNAPVDIPAARPLEQGFQLGTLTIDPRAGEVGGPGGREKLDPKVMDVLVMLAQHVGQVVLREHLLARVWPNSFATDEVLSRCIYELRKQLNLAGGSEQYKEMIETVPKRGYRLNGDVTFAPAPPKTLSTARRNWRLPALVAAAAAITLLAVVAGLRIEKNQAESERPTAARTANSIAVLPFIDMSAGQDQKYLSDGIAEEILNKLSQGDDLRVISRTSSFSFRERALDVIDIAARLNVSHVLEGSVRRSGNDVRITVQLIEVSSNSHVWSKTYARTVDDLFAVQDEIATSVAAALKFTLARASSKGRSPASVEAYESFLQGEFLFHRRAPGDVERSIKHYEKAISIDPHYARAWTGLAGAYAMLAVADEQVIDMGLVQRVGDAARRAVELDPHLAAAHLRLAQYYEVTSDNENAEEHWRQALALDPEDPLVLGGFYTNAIARGDFDEATSIARRSVAADPISSVSRAMLAVVLLADSHLDEAMSEYRKVLEYNPDAGFDVKIEIVRILVLQRRFAEAQAEIAQWPKGRYRDHGLALLYQAPGGRADADAALARLAAKPVEVMDSVRLAEVYAFRGMNEQALAVLHRKKGALERDRKSGPDLVGTLQIEARVSPFLKPLHTDARWTALLGEPG